MQSKVEIDIDRTIRQIKHELGLLQTIRSNDKYDYQPIELLICLTDAKNKIVEAVRLIERE